MIDRKRIRGVSERMPIETKYPAITVRMTGENGDAFDVIGRVSRALRRAGVPSAEIEHRRSNQKRQSSRDRHEMGQCCGLTTQSIGALASAKARRAAGDPSRESPIQSRAYPKPTPGARILSPRDDGELEREQGDQKDERCGCSDAVVSKLDRRARRPPRPDGQRSDRLAVRVSPVSVVR